MANRVKPLKGNDFYLLVGDGATPTEVFTFACIFNSIDSNKTADTEDAMILDCDDPTLLPARTTTVKMINWDIEGSGLLDPSKTGYTRLRTQFLAGDPVNLQLKKNLTGANGGHTEQAAFIITKMTETKADNGLVKCAFSFKNQSAITTTVNL